MRLVSVNKLLEKGAKNKQWHFSAKRYNLGMYIRSIITILLIFVLAACADDHEGASFSLKSALSSMEVSCDDLEQPKMGKLFWVKSVLDGTGILIISRSNAANEYLLSLTAHHQERALETRTFECK